MGFLKRLFGGLPGRDDHGAEPVAAPEPQEQEQEHEHGEGAHTHDEPERENPPSA